MSITLSDERFEKEKVYWINKLDADLQITGFPVDYGRRKSQQYIRKSINREFTDGNFKIITSMSNKSDYELFMILLSGVEYVLRSYTEAQEILVVMPVFKQHDYKGELINSILPLRTDVKKYKNFKELLSGIKETVFEANNNQNFPIMSIINALNLETASNGLPIIKTVVLFDSIHSEDCLHELVSDILFQFSKTTDGLEIVLHYNSLLYREETVGGILEYIMNFFDVVLVEPEIKLAEIEKTILKKQNDRLGNFCNSNTKFYDIFNNSEIKLLNMLKNLPACKEQSIVDDLGNIRKYVLSKTGDLKPIGIIGELCISEEIFRKNIFKTKPFKEVNPTYQNIKYGKLYRTGCLAKWLPDGNIEYVGRVNQYLDIKGCLINLREIELLMLEIDGIKEVKVIQKKDGNGHEILCSYFVSDKELEIEDLKTYISVEMQAYMVPKYFIQVESMPFMEDGILEEVALPEPFGSMDKSNSIGEIEEVLLNIWKSILVDGKFETDDDFFVSGGNSLLAIKLEVELEKHSMSFPSSEIYTYRTIKDQALYILINN